MSHQILLGLVGPWVETGIIIIFNLFSGMFVDFVMKKNDEHIYSHFTENLVCKISRFLRAVPTN